MCGQSDGVGVATVASRPALYRRRTVTSSHGASSCFCFPSSGHAWARATCKPASGPHPPVRSAIVGRPRFRSLPSASAMTVSPAAMGSEARVIRLFRSRPPTTTAALSVPNPKLCQPGEGTDRNSQRPADQGKRPLLGVGGLGILPPFVASGWLARWSNGHVGLLNE